MRKVPPPHRDQPHCVAGQYTFPNGDRFPGDMTKDQFDRRIAPVAQYNFERWLKGFMEQRRERARKELRKRHETIWKDWDKEDD